MRTLTEFAKNGIWTGVVLSLFVGAAVLGARMGADLAEKHTADLREPAPEAQAEPQEMELNAAEIDYLQWVLKEASKDTPLHFYPDNGVRADVQYARDNLTDDQRFAIWLHLETLRESIGDLDLKFELAPQDNNLDTDLLG